MRLIIRDLSFETYIIYIAITKKNYIENKHRKNRQSGFSTTKSV